MMMSGLLHPRDDLTIREVDGESVVLDLRNNEIHTLNESASYIWSLLDGKTSLEDVIQKVEDFYGLESGQAAKDVETVIDQLVQLKLLVTVD